MVGSSWTFVQRYRRLTVGTGAGVVEVLLAESLFTFALCLASAGGSRS